MFEPVVRERVVVEYDRVETGKLARKLRRDNKIRLKELARAMGVSIVYISFLERGERAWGPAVVRRFREGVQKILDERVASGV